MTKKGKLQYEREDLKLRERIVDNIERVRVYSCYWQKEQDINQALRSQNVFRVKEGMNDLNLQKMVEKAKEFTERMKIEASHRDERLKKLIQKRQV